MNPPTYGTLHAGDVVKGPDGAHWKVRQLVWLGGLEVVLACGDMETVGRPDPGTPVMVVETSDISAEYAACSALIAGFGAVEILGERWS